MNTEKTVKITKMQGCGNDFVVMDLEEFRKTNLEMGEFAKRICNRNFGVGADGLIIPEIDENEADIGWYFYNSDGTTAQMCGNGMRCFTKYVIDKNLVKNNSFSVKTGAGIIKPELLADGLVKVNMGCPILENEKIPYIGNGEIKVLDKTFKITPVSMGNPHCIIFTEENVCEMAKKYGPCIECHKDFPEKTNVEFIKIKNKNEIDFCVYERGCGITLACGTGACAASVACILNNLTVNKIKINLLGGTLTTVWEGLGSDIFLIGPSEYVFFADFIL